MIHNRDGWPIDYSTKLEDSAQWTLRYGTTERRESQRFSVASVLGAYATLTDPDLTVKEATILLRRARAARKGIHLPVGPAEGDAEPHGCIPQCRDFGCQDPGNPDCLNWRPVEGDESGEP